jgi:hypothetical protein
MIRLKVVRNGVRPYENKSGHQPATSDITKFILPRDNSNVEDYSIQRYATPVNINDSSGGLSSAKVSVPNVNTSFTTLDTDVEITDDSGNILFVGLCRDAELSALLRGSPLESYFRRLNYSRNLLPQYYNAYPTVYLKDALSYYFQSVGISPDGYELDIPDYVPVNFVGYEGNVWQFMKRVLAIHDLELVEVYNKVFIRQANTMELEHYNASALSTKAEFNNAYIKGEVYYYPKEAGEGVQCYPKIEETQARETTNVTIYSVTAGEDEEYEIQLNASMSEIYEPIYIEDPSMFIRVVDDKGNVVREALQSIEDHSYDIREEYYYDPDTEEYVLKIYGGYIVFMYDTPDGGIGYLSKADFEKYHGTYKIELVAHDRIKLSLHGPEIYLTGEDSPTNFKIGYGVIGADYPFLVLLGAGIRWTEKRIEIYTGITDQDSNQEFGVTINDLLVETIDEAMSVGHKAMCDDVFSHTLDATLHKNLNTESDIAGRRLVVNNAMFRITSVVSGPSNIRIVGNDFTMDTDFDKFLDRAFGETYDYDFDVVWWDHYDMDFTVQPLRNKVDPVSVVGPLVRNFNMFFYNQTVRDFNNYFDGKTVRDFNNTFREDRYVV